MRTKQRCSIRTHTHTHTQEDRHENIDNWALGEVWAVSNNLCPECDSLFHEICAALALDLAKVKALFLADTIFKHCRTNHR